MASSRSFGILVLIVVLAAGGGFAYWFVNRGNPDKPQQGGGTSAMPFRESAKEVGINWQMSFLPAEQGEKFKINLYDHGSGIAIADFDGDGRDDIYFLNQLGPNALYRNKGDGTFEEVTQQAGVAIGDRVCVAAVFVDYDNDGKPDLFVTTTRGGNILFRNEGNGKFKDVTKEAGLTHIGHSQTPLFFDFDNDGLLDLFLPNTAEWTTETYDPAAKYFVGKAQLRDVFLSKREYNVLYRNMGNGKFVDVTEKAGLKGAGWASQCVTFDYDGDGFMDLFVTCMVGRCQLYHNNHDGTFTDVTLKTLGKTPWGALGCKLIDVNNDGRLDLYVVDMHSDMWMGLDSEHRSLEFAQTQGNRKFSSRLGPFGENMDTKAAEKEREFASTMNYKSEEVLFGNAFYFNEGGGKFTEMSDRAGLETFWPWGIASGDFNNGGKELVFLPSGMGYPYYYWPNALLALQPDGKFRDVSVELGVEPPARGKFLPDLVGGKEAPRSSRSAAVGDFDGDGRLELVVNNFNDQPYYFKNHFPQRNYVAFRLRGTKSNRDAVGAVVRLHQGSKIMTRQIQAPDGYLAQSSNTVHFGLGDTDQIDKVEITWPGGKVQTIEKPPANKMHDIVESEK